MRSVGTDRGPVRCAEGEERAGRLGARSAGTPSGSLPRPPGDARGRFARPGGISEAPGGRRRAICARRRLGVAPVPEATPLLEASTTSPPRPPPLPHGHVAAPALVAAAPIPAARRAMVVPRAEKSAVAPLNGDPFVGMLETPVTSAPLVARYLSSLPAYRTAVAPSLRGVEIGLAHGFLVAGPFIKLGPLRNTAGADVAGCLSGAGLILILTACLSIYGSATFQGEGSEMPKKTLSGRTPAPDALQTGPGWAEFAAGFLVGGEAGVAWAYVCTQILPLYPHGGN